MKNNPRGLYILHISIHGLIRGDNLELGRDADTGGQTRYVVELSRALGKRSEVDKIILLTRLVDDPAVSSSYAQFEEILSEKVKIVRINCGEPGYIAKEQLWDSLDNFTDNTLYWLSEQEILPDIIHSHYADAGYVGTRLSHHFGIPLVHTGHSLGRTKRKRLLASGLRAAEIEKIYHISNRIEAEEETLGAAEMIITSTRQEIEEQYGVYDYYLPGRMRVVPPGIDLEKFSPPDGLAFEQPIYQELCRFFAAPDKPIILALSRPDPRKNIITLIETYGESKKLQEIANLVIVAGNRDEIADLDSGAREVLKDILFAIDRYDLYGKVAYPKHHQSNDVPILFKITAQSKGVFVNPALTEPFGLTIIEAAASGVPVVATEDGGPKDILENCQNGYLIDPLDKQNIEEQLYRVVSEQNVWPTLADNGIQGVKKHYLWEAHADKYLQLLKPIIEKTEIPVRMCLSRRPMLYHDRAIVTDLDQNLLGDPQSLKQLSQIIQDNRKCSTFAIATGRRLDSALSVMKKYRIPPPDILISSLGTEIYYAPNLTKDIGWTDHIEHLWPPKTIRRLLSHLPGVILQPQKEQSQFKISYYIDPEIAPSVTEINHYLLQHDQNVNIFLSFGQFLDIVPIRASKGFALRWMTEQWDIPLENCLVAGGSGADEDLMRGNTLAVVVANRHSEELSDLVNIERVYYAKEPYTAGIIEAIDHYDFFQACEVPIT